MLSDFIFYGTSVTAGVLVSILILLLRKRRERRRLTQTKPSIVSIERLEQAMCPPKAFDAPIDDIVKRLRTQHDAIPFHIDLNDHGIP